MKAKIFFVVNLILFLQLQIFCSNSTGIAGKRIVLDSTGTISFLAGGHLYGVTNSGYPASTFLANIDSINRSDVDFFVSLGDLFINLENDLITYQKSLFEEIEIPIFNAVGNHDLSQQNLYKKEFGNTYTSFKLNNNSFVILDTELNNGNISGNQLHFLRQLIEDGNINKVKNIFFFSHRPIWLSEYPNIKSLFEGADIGNFLNFSDTVIPLLKSSKANIYWLSGSMGGSAGASFFTHQERKNQFILTAIRDRKNDGLLRVNIDSMGVVTFKTVSLCEQQLKPLETYNINYWTKLKGVIPFSWAVMKYQIVRALRHELFWIGGIIFLLVFFLLKFVFRYIKVW